MSKMICHQPPAYVAFLPSTLRWTFIMTKLSFNLTKAETIIWPQQCAICGRPTGLTTAKTSCSIGGNLQYRVIYLGWTTRRVSLKYPVCHKHSLFASAIGLLAQRSLINLGIGFLLMFSFLAAVIAPLVEWVTTGIPPKHTLWMIQNAIAFFLGLTLFLWSQRSVPVKIRGVENEVLQLQIADPQFASLFTKLNEQAVTKAT